LLPASLSPGLCSVIPSELTGGIIVFQPFHSLIFSIPATCLKTLTSLRPVSFLTALFLSFCSIAQADQLKVAVASNFAHVVRILEARFQAETGHTLDVHYDASGDLKSLVSDDSNQFDLFLSADNVKTEELEQQGKILDGSRVVYAMGQLAFWHGQGTFVQPDSIKDYLTNTSPAKVTIADPEKAPYGHAAREALKSYGLYEELKTAGKLTFSEHVSQAWDAVNQPGGGVGFVPASLVIETDSDDKAIFFPVGVTLVPTDYYPALIQEMVIMKAAPHQTAAAAFSKFLLSQQTQQVIAANGYQLPKQDAASSSAKATNTDGLLFWGMSVIVPIKAIDLLVKLFYVDKKLAI
jgi:molybdenum ABC transporter molybdate-binding protein